MVIVVANSVSERTTCVPAGSDEVFLMQESQITGKRSCHSTLPALVVLCQARHRTVIGGVVDS